MSANHQFRTFHEGEAVAGSGRSARDPIADIAKGRYAMRVIRLLFALLMTLTACGDQRATVISHDEIYDGPEDQFLIDGWGVLCADPRSNYWRCVADRGQVHMAFFTDDRESYWQIAESCVGVKKPLWESHGQIGNPNTLARRMEGAINEARAKNLLVCNGMGFTREVAQSAQRIAKLLLSFHSKAATP